MVRVITKVLTGVKSVTPDKGEWRFTRNKGCTTFNIRPYANKPNEKFSLIVKTSDERKRYYFYKKNYHAKLCDRILNIKYTKKTAV